MVTRSSRISCYNFLNIVYILVKRAINILCLSNQWYIHQNILSGLAQDRYHVKKIINGIKPWNKRTSKPEGVIALRLFAIIVERSKGHVMTN